MAVENFIIFNQTNPVMKTVFVDTNYYNILWSSECVFWKVEIKTYFWKKYVAMT